MPGLNTHLGMLCAVTHTDAHRAAQCLPLGMVAFLLVEVSKRFPLAFFRMGAGRLIDLVLLSTTYLGILR